MEIPENPRKAKKIVGSLIANLENNPVLLDSNTIFWQSEKLFDLLRWRRLYEVNYRELKELRLYASFMYSKINENARILTVPEVVKEVGGLIESLQHVYRRRDVGYHYYAKDALMKAAKSKNAEDAQSLHVLSELRQVKSRLEKISLALEPRAERYSRQDKELVSIEELVRKSIAKSIAKHPEISEISQTDMALVTSAFYEALFFGRTPLILSLDKHIDIIINTCLYGNYFDATIRGILTRRIKTYRGITT